jgi:galactokinase
MTDQQLREQFDRTFGGQPDLIVRSPGRVNLIGEHTDYNDGWALPIALDVGTDVAARRRDDRILRIAAPQLAATDEMPVDDLRPRHGSEWTRYVRGIAALLRETGCQLPGADVLIEGDLPIGAGLSSSASLELAVAVAFAALAGHQVDGVALARLGQRVENEIVGVRSGIMDQLAIALGVAGHALRIDCRSLETEAVRIPPGVRILVLDSAVPRTLAGSAYNQRRSECDAALRTLQAVDPSLQALRDVTAGLLSEEGWRLTDVQLRRARHVVTEDQRVLDAVAALQRGDVDHFGQLLTDSHLSLRNDYEVSSPGLDTLVEIAARTPGVLGARLTGAGFGGCVIALVTTDHADRAVMTIAERYRQHLNPASLRHGTSGSTTRRDPGPPPGGESLVTTPPARTPGQSPQIPPMIVTESESPPSEQ